jgi:UDP-N-acetylmuramate: L-alanyl-gamma-D-glutamyl-meso-diaminopimelate ligase
MVVSRQVSSSGKSAYLIGIGGVGMSALAGMLCQRGYSVSGSDQALYPPASLTLEKLGIQVRTPYHANNVPADADLVVVGNACSRGHPEVEVVLERGIRYRSLPEVLKEEFLWDHHSLVVAGTHGKTTTASILAWLLEAGGRQPSYFIGGLPQNFGTSSRLGQGSEFVVEGDEYDSAFFDKRAKFLHYCPRGIILGAVEFDHSDIYRDIEEVELAFLRLLLLMPKTGLLVACGDHERVRKLASNALCPAVTFGLGDGNDWRAVNVDSTRQGMEFQLLVEGADRGMFLVSHWGQYNVTNALGAMTMAYHRGVPLEVIRKALPEFSGVARRMEELGTVDGVTFVDDFAHHPTAIGATIAGVRQRYPGRRVVAVFEPRSNTTVRRFLQEEIAQALAGADLVFIGPIYRGDSIPPKERLDIPWILHSLELSGISAIYQKRFHDLVPEIRARIHAGDVVVLMSNGSFGGIASQIMHKKQSL